MLKFILFHFQINNFRINHAPSAQVNGIKSGLPIQEICQVMNQQLGQSAENHANLVNEPYSNTRVGEDFSSEIIAVLENRQLEVS